MPRLLLDESDEPEESVDDEDSLDDSILPIEYILDCCVNHSSNVGKGLGFKKNPLNQKCQLTPTPEKTKGLVKKKMYFPTLACI